MEISLNMEAIEICFEKRRGALPFQRFRFGGVGAPRQSCLSRRFGTRTRGNMAPVPVAGKCYIFMTMSKLLTLAKRHSATKSVKCG